MGSIQFGKYLLMARLGKGGMAEVYRAELTGPEGFVKVVALKVLHSGIEESDKHERALIDEARLCGLLDHGNVVRVQEFGKYCGRYYLAMEYMDGWSVSQLLNFCREQRQWLPVSVAVEIMLMVSRGVHYAHTKTDRQGNSMGIVHRDIKADNIMVSRSGDVKVMDFGIARAKTQSNLTKTGMTRGTPTCMSPEQIMGKKELDHRSDIFALGIMLTELIALRLAFTGDVALAVMHKILGVMKDEQAMASVQKRAPSVVPVIERCLQLEPDERFQTVADMAHALREAVTGLQGPTLAEWLEQVASKLPAEVADGHWGADGPPNMPQPVDLYDTPEVPPSVLPVPSREAERLLSRSSAAIAPILRDGALEWADVQMVYVEVPEDEMPPRAPRPTPARLRTTDPRRRKRKRASGSMAKVVVGIGVVGLLLLGVGIVAMVVKSTGTTNSDHGRNEPTAPPPDMEVVETPLPSLAVTPAPTPAVHREPTPTVRREPTPAVIEVEPTPEPLVPLEEPATGTIKVNSVPWAMVTIRRTDGSVVVVKGNTENETPVELVDSPAGQYSAHFKCGDSSLCGEQTSTLPFTVHAGSNLPVVNRF